MNSSHMRTLDVNINRAAEGLRVLEDIARYHLEDSGLTTEAKRLRHNVRKKIGGDGSDRILYRDAESDHGPRVSQVLQVEDKTGVSGLIKANSRRAQEALRSLEEHLRLTDTASARLTEKARYEAYTLEKNLLMAEEKGVHRDRLKKGIYGITASEFSEGRSNIDIVKAMIDGGIKVIQYREKQLSPLEMFRESIEIRKLTADNQVTFIMNDWTDIALAVNADGLHTGQDDLPFEVIKNLVPGSMILGRSTHSPNQAQKAVSDGADYLGIGPLYSTKTKVNVCAAVGLEYLRYAAEHVKIPFVAIGGIKRHNLPEVLKAGASQVCLVTEITTAPDIPKRIDEINSIISAHTGETK